MKIKILALIMAVFCLSTVLAGCGEKACETHVDNDTDGKCDVCEAALCELHTDAELDGTCDVCAAKIPVSCAEHKDENADKICDVCKNAIVVIVEQLPPSEETRVDMVVNPIPENVNLGDYVITKVDSPAPITELEQLDIAVLLDYKDNVWAYCTEVVEEENESYYRYVIYDFEKGEEILRNVSLTDKTEDPYTVKTVSIDLDTYYFTVAVSVVKYDEAYTYSEDISNSLIYYTYSGEEIDRVTWDQETALDPWLDLLTDGQPEFFEFNDVMYITFDEKVWAFDAATAEILGKRMDPMSLVYRPAFDEICEDKYGYVEKDGKIFVYDLNFWINCTYSYDIPDQYASSSWFVLANGNVLVQGIVRLPSSAISYDYMDGGSKYDIVYTVVDPSAKTATNVEFGYYVMSIETPAEGEFTDKVVNVATVAPIVNDVISESVKTVALNNDLTVAADLTEAVDLMLIADGCFLDWEQLDELAYATYVVDANGNEIAYVPYDAVIMGDYIVYDDKVYNVKMEEMRDLSEYNIVSANESYMILSSEQEDGAYYHYDPKSNRLVRLEYQLADVFEGLGYVASYLDAENGIRYAFYNRNAQMISDDLGGIVEYIYPIEDAYILAMPDGTYYIAK